MKRKLSILTAAITCAAIMVGAAACAKDGDSSTTEQKTEDTKTADKTPDEPKAENITLKFWEGETEGGAFMKYAADEYHKLHPNVSFEFEPVAHTDATQKILLDGPAGVGADLFALPHDMLGANVNGGTVSPIAHPDFVTNNFVSAAVSGATFGGSVYGYPLAIETYALFYNKDLLPTPPKNWDEVVDFCKTFNDPSQNKYGIVWETSNAYFDYIFFSGYGSQLFGPTGADRSQHNINAPATIKSVEYFQSLRSVLDVPSGDLGADFCNSAFESGKAAMYLVGPWRIEDCKKSGINFGITTIPAFPGESTPPASFSGVRLLCVSAYSKHPAEANDFAEFLSSKEMQTKRFDMLGQLPARNDITVDDEYSNGILAQAAYAFPMPSIDEMGQYWQTMGAAYGNIWDGADVKGELNAAAEVMEATIAAAIAEGR